MMVGLRFGPGQTWRLNPIMGGMCLNVRALTNECAQQEAYVRMQKGHSHVEG